MPYPESCPECGGTFRNTGTHFTARRNEVGRHVLLELGCQNTSRRFWWNFSTGKMHDAAQSSTQVTTAAVPKLSTNGHSTVATLEPPTTASTHRADAQQPEVVPLNMAAKPSTDRGALSHLTDAAAAAVHAEEPAAAPSASVQRNSASIDQQPTEAVSSTDRALQAQTNIRPADPPTATPQAAASDERGMPAAEAPDRGAPPQSPGALKEAFVRQLQLDRLTLRQMRSLLMADEARRAIEVAAGATEATYERLALILFGVDLAQLLGKQVPVAANTGMSAEERLELQREKARIRARLRRAAIKAAKLNSGA
jgi:hypothetical protein